MKIPNNLDEAIAILDRNTDAKTKQHILDNPISVMGEFHHFSGMALRNEWGLWTGSVLRDWFLERGVFHADDMSGIIMDAFWCKLHDQPVPFDEWVQFYKDYWEKVRLAHSE